MCSGLDYSRPAIDALQSLRDVCSDDASSVVSGSRDSDSAAAISGDESGASLYEKEARLTTAYGGSPYNKKGGGYQIVHIV